MYNVEIKYVVFFIGGRIRKVIFFFSLRLVTWIFQQIFYSLCLRGCTQVLGTMQSVSLMLFYQIQKFLNTVFRPYAGVLSLNLLNCWPWGGMLS